jgi:DNA-binding IclR family transcriptional regulator
MSRTADPNRANDPRYNIRVLDRAIRILTLLSDGKPRTTQEISEGIELASSTTFRLLSTLVFNNYVRRDEQSGDFSLGLACLELAHAYQQSNDIRRVALPELESLRDELRETVHLVVMDRMQVVYLEKLSGLHAVGIMSSRVGARSPSYCTGVGKVLLAYQNQDHVKEYFSTHEMRQYTDTTITDINMLLDHLHTIRKAGFGFDFGEHENEVRCVAVPIFDIRGRAVAALSVSGPAARMDPIEDNKALIESARQTGLAISRKLGYNPANQNAG